MQQIERLCLEDRSMNRVAVVFLLVGGSSLALAQGTGGSVAGGTGSTGYAGGALSTGHTISGTAGSSAPNVGNALGHAATAGDVWMPPR